MTVFKNSQAELEAFLTKNQENLERIVEETGIKEYSIIELPGLVEDGVLEMRDGILLHSMIKLRIFVEREEVEQGFTNPIKTLIERLRR